MASLKTVDMACHPGFIMLISAPADQNENIQMVVKPFVVYAFHSMEVSFQEQDTDFIYLF